MFFLLSAFLDFFPEKGSFKTISEYGSKIRLIDDSCFFVTSCSFRNIVTTEGIIYCTIDESWIVISNTILKSCFITDTTGSNIYLKGTKERTVLSYICGINCSSRSNGVFSYQETESNYPIFDEMVSVSYCVNNVDNTYGIINVYKGQQNCSNCNVSSCISNNAAGIYTWTYSPQRIVYTSIHSNRARYSRTINTHNSCDSNWISMNIINNTSPQNYGVVYSDASVVKFNNCVIHSNYNILFYANTGTITVLNSHVKHNYQLSYGSLSTTNVILTISQALPHDTYQCENDPVNSYGTQLFKSRFLFLFIAFQ